MSFSSFDLHTDLLRRLEERGFTDPTPLQQEALPPALEGRNLLIRASAGSGKTTALLLPVLQRLLGASDGAHRAVVLAAEARGLRRILGELEALTAEMGLSWAEVGGGGTNGAALPEVDLLVATPEDLVAHLEGEGSLDGVMVLAVDEVDRMLERGLQPVLESLLEHLPPERQTLLFAASLPAALTSFAESALTDPLRVGWRQEAVAVAESFLPVREELKGALLLDLLHRSATDRALIFARTKHRANRLSEWLRGRGIPSERIHGNRSHRQRNDALNGFASGKYQALVATDVTFDRVGGDEPFHVVNYDVPNSPDDYRERFALCQGEIWTLVADRDESRFRALERGFDRELPVRTLESFDYDAPPAEGLEVPMEETAVESQGGKKGKSRRSRGKGKGERKRTEPGQGEGPAQGDVDLDEEEEARIRQKAERIQAAAVAARLGRPQPWTAGWQEREAQQARNRRPKRKSRGR